MRKIACALTLVACLELAADEMDKIDAIVENIGTLRSQYEQEKIKYETCKLQLLDEKHKNKILLQEIESYESLTQKEKEYESSIKKLKRQIAKLKKHLKPETATVVVKKHKSKSVQKKLLITTIPPATYRLVKDAAIYAYPEKNILTRWEKGTSFTSNTKAQGWIKITGYFVHKKWKPAPKEMWIREANTRKR